MRSGQDSDTALRGANHISGAEHLTILPKSMRALLFIPRLLRYDFIVAQDNLLLGYVVSMCARVFGFPTKWLYVAMTSSTLMRRHANHPVRLSLFKKFWSSYARIACISYEQIEDFVRFGVPRSHIVFVPFGVDARFFHSTDESLEEDLVVSVGRDAGRDYATLFRAAEHTNHKFVVVAGHKNISQDMPVPKNVSVLYDRSLAEIRELYARARLVVVVSKDISVPDGSDCSGQTVILDALAACKAVIATDRPWITDYFVPGQDLEVVPPNSPEAIVQAIDALYRDDKRREQIAMSGHNKVAAHYATKNLADALLQLMDSIV